jgi:hypothetical protein
MEEEGDESQQAGNGGAQTSTAGKEGSEPSQGLEEEVD